MNKLFTLFIFIYYYCFVEKCKLFIHIYKSDFLQVDSPKNPSVANGKNRRSTIIGSSTAARSTSDVTKTKLSMTTSENALRPGRSSQDVAGKQTSKSRAGLVPKGMSYVLHDL